MDPRPAVRKSAGQTMFSTIAAHGTLLQQPTWHIVVWKVPCWHHDGIFVTLVVRFLDVFAAEIQTRTKYVVILGFSSYIKYSLKLKTTDVE